MFGKKTTVYAVMDSETRFGTTTIALYFKESDALAHARRLFCEELSRRCEAAARGEGYIAKVWDDELKFLWHQEETDDEKPYDATEEFWVKKMEVN